MLFFNKKEDKKGLPDLPPLPNTRPSTLAVPTASSFPSIPKFPASTTPKIDKDKEEEDDNDFNVEKHALPSFPDSPMSKSFSQAAIKDAIATGIKDSDDEDNNEHIEREQNHEVYEQKDREITALPNLPLIKRQSRDDFEDSQPSNKNFKAIEMEEWKPEASAQQIQSRTNRQSPSQSSPQFKNQQKESRQRADYPKPLNKNSDIFVKLDKFRSAKRALDETKAKVEEK